MANSKNDLVAKRFGKLVAVRVTSIPGKRNSYWVCLCDCGEETLVSRPHLINGGTKSCGCYRTENNKKIHTTHGYKGTTIYSKWQSMKCRCRDKKGKNRTAYFDRNITYCKEWENFYSFLNDMGSSYQKHVDQYGGRNTTLDRIDVKKGYYKDNCRWATLGQQAENKNNNKWFIGRNLITGEVIFSRNQKKTAREIFVDQGSISHALKVDNFKVKVRGIWIFKKINGFKYRKIRELE